MKFALLTAALLAVNILLYPGSTEAANEDDELSIMAAEQRKDDDANVTVRDDVEVFGSSISSEDIAKTGDKAPVESDKPAPEIPKADNTDNKSANTEQNTVPESENSSTAGMPNPIVTYSNFEDAAKKVGFIPLYVPKKSGFAMNYIAVIGGNIAEIRYGKRWEPKVTLSIRTYKRSPGEELKDISGVHGVKWRMDMTSGMTIYIARVSNDVNAAAWSVGSYTFAAMTENLSFAAFHAFIVEELVDLCNHYFIMDNV